MQVVLHADSSLKVKQVLTSLAVEQTDCDLIDTSICTGGLGSVIHSPHVLQ